MTVGPRRALSEIRKNFLSLNWWRNRVFVPYLFGTATRLYPRYPGYTDAVSVMDEDWDTLIVLDACRADAFQNVADLDRFDDYETRISLGSHSSEWTRRNFAGGSFGDTVYVSANPHTSLEAGDAFHRVIELWESGTDEDEGAVLPEYVVKAAKDAHMEFQDKRLIVHFMQPHGPFVGSDLEGPYETDEAYWQAYQENLDHVLDYALDLADAIPGRTVFTADHGQIRVGGLQERLGIGGHKPRLRLPGLVHIPWAVLEGPARTVQSDEINEASGKAIEDRLKQLGYR